MNVRPLCSLLLTLAVALMVTACAPPVTSGSTNTPVPVETPLPDAVVLPGGAELRAGPDVLFPLLTKLPGGQPLEVTGAMATLAWLQVRAGDHEGWVPADRCQTEVDLRRLPVVTVSPIPEEMRPICTVLPCKNGEVYYCPGECASACDMICVTATAATPHVMCTPPACQEGEVYYCPDECPGGCGTTCATPTPRQVMCTPPACQDGEVFYCPDQCPGGCGTTCATPTPPATPTRQVMCTPPACNDGEVYYCRDECPGGCGTTCATPTPAP